MHLSSYQTKALETDVAASDKNNPIPWLGLFGEIGSLLSALKKHLREKESFATYQTVVEEELGDCLWYLANICSRSGVSFDELAIAAIVKNTNASELAQCQAPTMDQLQEFAKKDLATSERNFEADLFHLGAIAGRLLDCAQRDDQTGVREVLEDMIWSISKAAVNGDVSLVSAAEGNLKKNTSRWPGKDRKYLPLFDEPYPDEERLPRNFEIAFHEVERAGRTFVILRCNDINIGDRLTDNKIDRDDYRFHDIFHLAYAAYLGWSPVLRTLFRVKRKSDPAIDEAQDGARAIIIEEGLSTWIFGRALGLNCFAGLSSVDYSLLKSIRDFVDGFEVHRCPYWQWEEAILGGFSVFRDLKKHRGGVVAINLLEHSLTFRGRA